MDCGMMGHLKPVGAEKEPVGSKFEPPNPVVEEQHSIRSLRCHWYQVLYTFAAEE